MHAQTDTAGDTVAEALIDYRRRWPGEAGVVTMFEELLAARDDTPAGNPFMRERLAGHLTASSWLVDRSGLRVLLTHNRKLDRW